MMIRLTVPEAGSSPSHRRDTMPAMSTPAAAESSSHASTLSAAVQEKRYLALDAFRGFIMIMLAAEGFGFGALRNDPVWGGLAYQFGHVPWEGGVFWDMIQPSFMFMVGVAMPFALARRIERGATFRDNFHHIVSRALKLILLSQILMCISGNRLHFQLINVLSQIAFTYFLSFLIMQLRFRWQAIAAAFLLVFHWGLFVMFPGPEGPFSQTGNVGQMFDYAVLGYNYPGKYVTINFLSSTVTTLFGVWTGLLLKSDRTRAQKLKILAGSMAACFVLGLALSPVIPLVKRIWTPSFTLYSTGWVLFMMLAFFWLIEVRGYRKFAFPLVVVGMNSIFIYSVGILFGGGIRRAVGVFTGNFTWVGALATVVLHACSLLFMWYVCYWLYKRKIFFKL